MNGSPIVGIDLGTTHSAVGLFRDGRVTLFENELGQPLTPSVVAMDPRTQGLVVGRTAKDIIAASPGAGAANFKLAMGSDRRFTVGTQQLTAVELSAFVLDSLKADAERALGCPVQRCVVTVPAYFDDAQRAATKQAAELAGFVVDRVLNEPTAAAIAYGLHRAADESRFLVFDLGGGTFDVCVMELFEGMLRVESVAGESRLGGEDFTRHLAELVLERAGIEPEQARRAPDAMMLLHKRSEVLKRTLSKWPAARVAVPDLGGGAPREIEVSAAEAEHAWAPLLDRLRGPCRTALRSAGVEPTALAEIILVGGATRMPCVHRFVSEVLGRQPIVHGDPDHVVAEGAAIQAALCADDGGVGDLVVTDIASHSLGIESGHIAAGQVRTGYFLPIIHRGTVIPVSRTEILQPLVPGSTKLELEIYQGDARKTAENALMGTLAVTGVPRSAEKNEIAVTFTYDLDGILAVEARVLATGDRFECVFQRGEVMTGSQLEAALERIRYFRANRRERPRHRDLLARAELLWKESPPDRRIHIGAALQAFEAALDGQADAEIELRYRELEEVCQRLDGGDRW